MRRLRFSPAAASLLAWLGLALMTASFLVLLDSSPAPSSFRREGIAAEKPFSVVVIDAGHGGRDSGAHAGTLLEKNLTLDVARRTARLLTAKGLTAKLTRTDDVYVPLAERAALSNRTAHSILVSIHFNEGDRPLAGGIETYFAAHQSSGGPHIATWLPFLRSRPESAPNEESPSLAGFIQEELVARTHAGNRGTKCEQFYVLAQVEHPAVLVEGGFLTNKQDAARLRDGVYREQLASALTAGILRYRSALQPVDGAAPE